MLFDEILHPVATICEDLLFDLRIEPFEEFTVYTHRNPVFSDVVHLLVKVCECCIPRAQCVPFMQTAAYQCILRIQGI